MDAKASSLQLWGGRFEGALDAEVFAFNASLSIDQRLLPYDIQGSLAHARMLGHVGLLDSDETRRLTQALESLQQQAEAGTLALPDEAEDVHTAVEMLLTAELGDLGKKLHTGRSRNDQVALDTRLWARDAIVQVQAALSAWGQALVAVAGEHLETLMPGMTHLQAAQPITLAHHLAAYAEMALRDWGRLEDCYKRVNLCPLGSGALATSSLPLDRAYVARALNFEGITANSLDAVSDRDYLIELVAALALVMTHVSRLAEELILWNSQLVGWLELDDAFATGSSLMPQKKNPDIPELVRGKTGRVTGHLMALFTIMKALPLAYNKDLQEDKAPVFDAVDTTLACLRLMCRVLETSRFDVAAMRAAAGLGYLNATDVADYLVEKGIPFRTAHELVGKAVRVAMAAKCPLDALPLEDWQRIHPGFETDIYEAIALETCLGRRALPGGPAPAAVGQHLEALKARFGGKV